MVTRWKPARAPFGRPTSFEVAEYQAARLLPRFVILQLFKQIGGEVRDRRPAPRPSCENQPVGSMRGNVKKIFLPRAEAGQLVMAFSPARSRSVVCVRLCGAGSSPTNGRREAADDVFFLAFPLDGKRCCERPAAVQGAPIGAAELPWTARTVLK